MNKKIVLTGGVLMFLGVMLAALGSHVLAAVATPKIQSAFDTGVRFLIYHGLVFLIFGGSSLQKKQAVVGSFKPLLVGVVMFSGSIFVTAALKILEIDTSSLWWVTPFGGGIILFGWAVFIYQLIQSA